MKSTSGSAQKRRGRPPSPPELCRSQRVVTFVTTSEMEQLSRLADDGEQTLSATIYQLIKQGLSNPGDPAK